MFHPQPPSVSLGDDLYPHRYTSIPRLHSNRMPSPSFLTKAFIAGFLFGHLFLPAEKSWLFKLARSSAFEVPLRSLSHLNTTSAGNGPQQAQGTDSLRYLVNDSTPVLSHPLLRNPTVSSNLTTNRHLTPTQIPTNQPTLSREISTLVLPNSSDPVTYRPSPTRATVSTTLYYLYGLPSASAQPPIPVVIPPRQPTGLGSSLQFRLTFHMLLCISILLYHTILFIYRKWKPRCKAHKLPERAVSMIIANLQDPQSLRACSLVSRSWAKESRRHLFHTISLDSKQSADLWFSPDTHGLTSHVRSIRLSVEAIAGAEHGLSRFLSVKTLRILDWRGTQSSLPTGWSSLTRTVDRLELVRPGGTTYEILTFVSLFKSLESLYITRTNQQSRCEVRATRVGDPETLSIRFRMLRHPSTNGISPTRSCSGNGISVRLRESGWSFLVHAR